MAGKYIPPEKMTVPQIREQIRQAFDRWDRISKEGCSDPYWPDGLNMNLERGHIIFWYGYLAAALDRPVQMSLFADLDTPPGERPVPPEVPDGYMSPTGKHPDRLSPAFWPPWKLTNKMEAQAYAEP